MSRGPGRRTHDKGSSGGCSSDISLNVRSHWNSTADGKSSFYIQCILYSLTSIEEITVRPHMLIIPKGVHVEG